MEKTRVSSVFKIRLSLVGFCNYKCYFCHNEGRRQFERIYMAPDQALLLSKAAFNAGINSITFTGGDPFIHPKAFDIIKSVRKALPTSILKLTTNGALIKESDIPVLQANIDRIRLNFQAVDRENYHKFVGRDTFSKIMAIIEAIRKKTNIHLCLNYVYTSLSQHLLHDVVKFAVDNEIELKVLELIKNSANAEFYYPIDIARQFLQTKSSSNTVDYQDDDLYFFKNSSSRVRLCYAHCNTLNGTACRKLGELRVSPDLMLYTCMLSEAERVFLPLINPLTEDAVTKEILKIDCIKGICPNPSDTSTQDIIC